MGRCWLLPVFLCLCTSIELWGQRPGGPPSDSPNFDGIEFSPDTLDAEYFYQDDPQTLYRYQDTLIRYVHEYDLPHLAGASYFNLGYPGSAVRPVLAIPTVRTGFQLGLDQFDPYTMDETRLRFYRMKKALAYASYLQGQSQDDNIFRALFSRNFKDGLQVSLDYNRYNNVGLYERQAAKNTNLGVGLWYKSPNERFEVFLNHFANTYEQQNNGGITTDTVFSNDLFDERFAVPVHLEGAETRDQDRAYSLVANYRITGPDSAQSESSGLGLQYKMRSSRRIFRFSDDEVPFDGYYGDFLTDDRGVRLFTNYRKLANEFNVNFAGKQPGQVFGAGIKNIIHRISPEPTSDRLTEWFAQGRLDWSLKERFSLRSDAQLGINKESTTYLLRGLLTIDLKNAGILEGKVSINQRAPNQLERQLFVSQVEVWDNDFKNVLVNHVQASYRLPRINLSIEGGQVLVTNGIFFDQNALPQQSGGTAAMTYLRARKSFSLGSFVNENKIVLQSSNEDRLFRIPDWYTEHSLYLLTPVFRKVLNFKTGFEARFHGNYGGLTYRPFLGQFVLPTDGEIKFYPLIDYHLALQVKFFRAYAKLENVLQMLRKDIYYQTNRYPQQDFAFKLGISWIFID